MAYDLIVDGDQVDLASISGWKQFKEEMGQFPEVNEFRELVDGVADARDLYVELSNVEPARLTPPSRSILMNMRQVLKGKTGDAVVTEGFTDKEVDEQWVVSD